MSGKHPSTEKKDTGTRLNTNKEICLEIHTEETKYLFLSHYHDTG